MARIVQPPATEPTNTMRATLTALSCLALAGCVASSFDGDKTGSEEDAPIDGAYDSFRSPIDHGALLFGRAEHAELTAAEGFHAWTFSLSGRASVALRTELAMPGLREVDTMLYLYREGPTGWGRAIASNDDTMGSLFSGLSRTLEAGRYRILVKGYLRSTRGPFGVVAECSGTGCGTTVDSCLFGDTFGSVPASLRLLVGYSSTHTTAADLSPVLSAQLIRALNAAGHAEVTTADAALALCDGGSAERFEIYDSPGGRAFTAWRFALGDHFFGSIFAAGTTTPVTRIVDDANTECTVGFESCMVGSTFREFAEADSLEVVSDAVLTTATGLSTARAAQLVRAVQEAYDEVRTAAEAIARVDGGTVNQLVRRDRATGRTFVAFEYGAGDNSYGSIFEGESATPVGRVNDGDMYGCTVFRAPRPPALAGEDCSRAALCAEGLRCVGVAEDEGVGRCASLASLPGNEASCSASAPCMPGLVCSGLSRYPDGICRAEWMRGTYRSSTRVAIPDANAVGASSGVLVYGLATVDTDVEVTVRVAHARSTDLRIVLVNAAGTEQPVWDGATSPLQATPFEITRTVLGSGDESVTGHWYLRVIDSRRGTSGTLESWSLTVMSRWD